MTTEYRIPHTAPTSRRDHTKVPLPVAVYAPGDVLILGSQFNRGRNTERYIVENVYWTGPMTRVPALVIARKETPIGVPRDHQRTTQFDVDPALKFLP